MIDPSPKKTRTLMIGWDSADWQIMKPMIEQGQMPTLKGLMDRGVHGNLATLEPVLSPMLWNSIATGKRAFEHGIFGFMEVNADGTDVQPVTSTSRTTRALWNILHHQGYHTNVLNWFASHPAEPIRGVCVSDQYAKVGFSTGEREQVPEDAVSPASWREPLSDLRVTLEEITEGDVAPFIAPGAEIDDVRDQAKLQAIRKLIAELTATHSAATMVMEEEPWDFVGVYYQTLDLAKHHFMEYHPPRMAHIPEEEFNKYRDVIINMYRFHDLMLARLLELAGEDTLVLLCSDHGFLNDHMRPKDSSPHDPKQAASWHRQHGMFVMAGPGIAQGQEVYGAGLLDLLPTLLTAMDLPVGSDMTGRVLLPVFENPPKVQEVPSWDAVEGDFGEHPPDKKFSPLDAKEAMKHLVELGYLADVSDDTKARVAEIDIDMRKNQLRSLWDASRIADAKEVADGLYRQDPDDPGVTAFLAQCEQMLGNTERAKELAERVTESQPQAPHVRQMLLRTKLKETNDTSIVRALVDEYIEEEGEAPAFLPKLGHTLLDFRHSHEACRVFHLALDQNPDNANAFAGLAAAHVRMHDYEAGIDYALKAIALDYNQAAPHASLGWALARTGQFSDAFTALNQAIALRPGWNRPYRMLAAISRSMGAEDLAAFEERRAEQAEQATRVQVAMAQQVTAASTAPSRQTQAATPASEAASGLDDGPFITVVSGLPRSGTSLMMQALDAGGIPPLTDAQRQADEDNPRGY